MIVDRIKAACLRIMHAERCLHTLTLSCCTGIYLAFSPLVGIKSVVILALSALFRLNAPVMFITCTLIHNPWTMIPLYLGGYWFGQWLLADVDVVAWDPIWMHSVKGFLAHYVGINNVTLLPFVVGCNVIGIFMACAAYPLVRRVFGRYAHNQTIIQNQ